VLWFGDYSFNRPGPPPSKNVRKIIYVIVHNVSVHVAIGVGTDGYRKVLGIAGGHKEDKAG
jgi:transposase-like protein